MARNWNLVKVKLECGCTVALKNPPLVPHIKFTCSMASIHGYSNRWLSYDKDGYFKENK